MHKTKFTIIPADTCNLACSFCCVAKCEGSSQSLMAIDDSKKYADIIAKYFVKNNIDYLELEFFGGEPLLNLDAIKEFINTLLATNDRYGCIDIIDCCMFTNGSCNLEEYIEFINEINKDHTVIRSRIQFSYDGPPHLVTQDAQKTNIDYLKKAIELTKEHDESWQLSCMIVVSDQNADNLFNLFMFLYEEKLLEYITFRFDIEHSDYKQLADVALPQLQQIINFVKSHPDIQDNDDIDFLMAYKPKDNRHGCGVGTTVISLSANGYITGCQHDAVLIEEKLSNRVYKKLTCVDDIENYLDLSYTNDWYQIGKYGHAEYEDICPAHYEKVKDDPDRKEFFRKVHEIVKQLDEGGVLNEDTKNTTDKHNIKDM